MKFSLSWLKTHLDTSLDAQAISDWLTKIGIEVESVEYPGQKVAHITVARIAQTAPHPHADRLKVCQVETFEGVKEVVCGAPNAREGLLTAFVAPGQVVPVTGEKLKPAVIRQVASHGMLCSAQELCIEDICPQEGIMELDSSFKVGESLADALGLNDAIFTVSVTPNRSDWLSVQGIGRDLAAAGAGTLVQSPDFALSLSPPCGLVVEIQDSVKAECPYFLGRMIEGVRNGPSPQWLQERLRAAGQKPINAVVDILNFVMFDVGRPMHAFDADRLSGTLYVRHASEGESLGALNGKSYELAPNMLVIADDRGPVSLAGIMGGESTGCTFETTRVFLESAYFEPASIATTGRKLNLHSESRFRFERGVDPAWVQRGLDRATQLIVEICGGQASQVVSAGHMPSFQKQVKLTRGRLMAYGGMDIPSAPLILEKLGFDFDAPSSPVWGQENKASDEVHVLTPSWRHDVSLEEDLIEEVLRIHGYDQIPETFLPLKRPQQVRPSKSALARRLLASKGLMEMVGWSFIPEATAQVFGWSDPQLKLINPISQDMSVMRPSLLPGLLKACQGNIDRAQPRVALFEVEYVYTGVGLDEQHLMAAGVRCGAVQEAHWAYPSQPSGVYDVKSDVWGVIQGLGVHVQSLRLMPGEKVPAYYHPGRSTAVVGPDNKILAIFGELHPRVAAHMDLDKTCFIFEIYLDAFASQGTKKPRGSLVLDPLLPLERDFAFLVSEKTEGETLLRSVKKAHRHIASVILFDVFSGKGVTPGMKSMAIRVKIQPQGASLTDEQIAEISQAIVAAAEKSCQGTLRT